MLALGTGEILGSLAFGRVTDKCKFKVTILLNILAVTLSYIIILSYISVYEFSFGFASTFAFFWGVQDASANCLVNSLLGFQFASKTTPFSVFKFVQSLMCFIVTCICSATNTRESYLGLFAASYAFAMFAWVTLLCCFKMLTQEQVEALRRDQAKLREQGTQLTEQ